MPKLFIIIIIIITGIITISYHRP